MSCSQPLMLVNPTFRLGGSSKKLDVAKFTMAQKIDPYVQAYVTVPCGKCLDCRKKYAREWRTRIQLELSYGNKKAIFFTGTIASEYYQEDKVSDPYYYVRRFLDRYRKAQKHSLRYFFINEYGKDHDRLHFHAIFFNNSCSVDRLRSIWKYGFIAVKPITSRRVNYILKYLVKGFKDKKFKSKIYASQGIGKPYLDHFGKDRLHSSGDVVSVGNYLTSTPRYLYNKIYTDKERHKKTYEFHLQYPYGVYKNKPLTEEEKNNLLKHRHFKSNYLGYEDKTKQNEEVNNNFYTPPLEVDDISELKDIF